MAGSVSTSYSTGITSAPEIFQKRMDNLLKDQEGMAAIQDDIIVFGRSVAEQDARLQQVFTTTEKSGLKLNERKCEIRKPNLFILFISRFVHIE